MIRTLTYGDIILVSAGYKVIRPYNDIDLDLTDQGDKKWRRNENVDK